MAAAASVDEPSSKRKRSDDTPTDSKSSTVDSNTQKCQNINCDGVVADFMQIFAKSGDRLGLTIDLTPYNGYTPSGLGIGSDKYIDFSVCVKCGTVVNWKPLSRETVKQILIDAEKGDDDNEADKENDVPNKDK